MPDTAVTLLSCAIAVASLHSSTPPNFLAACAGCHLPPHSMEEGKGAAAERETPLASPPSTDPQPHVPLFGEPCPVRISLAVACCCCLPRSVRVHYCALVGGGQLAKIRPWCRRYSPTLRSPAAPMCRDDVGKASTAKWDRTADGESCPPPPPQSPYSLTLPRFTHPSTPCKCGPMYVPALPQCANASPAAIVTATLAAPAYRRLLTSGCLSAIASPPLGTRG